MVNCLPKKTKGQQDKLWNLIYKRKKKELVKKRDAKPRLLMSFIKQGKKLLHHLEKKELVEPIFEWIRDTEAFNGVLDMVETNIGL